jgi:branched-chain amino acid transport system substrate-binding protein
MHSRRFRLGLVGLAAALAVAAVAGTGFTSRKSAGVIKIAMVAPLTGPYVFIGSPETAAAQKAVTEINDKGGILGKKLQLDILDDATNPAQSLTQTQKVLNDPSYVAMIGTGFSSSAFADEPVAAGKILYISMAASQAQVLPPQPGVFVVPPTSRLFAYRMAIELRKLGIHKIALLHDNGGYPTEGVKNVQQIAKTFGLDIVSDQSFSLTATDFSAQLTQIKNSGAQAVWLWNLPQAVAITRQYKQLGLPQQLVLTGGNATPQYIGPACPEENGAYIDSPLAQVAKGLPKGYPSKALALHVDKIMGGAGNQFYYDGYTGIQLIAQAIRMAHGNTDRQTLIKQFDHFKMWGPEGLYTFTALKHAGINLPSVVTSKIASCEYKLLPGQVPTKWPPHAAKSKSKKKK